MSDNVQADTPLTDAALAAMLRVVDLMPDCKLHHSFTQMTTCVTTKPAGHGSPVATCHDAIIHAGPTYAAEYFAEFFAMFDPPTAAALVRECQRGRERVAVTVGDWADDHTHLQELCRKAGLPDARVSGDSHGVPGIADLADMLAMSLEGRDKALALLNKGYESTCEDRDRLKQETRTLAAEVARLRAALERIASDAPYIRQGHAAVEISDDELNRASRAGFQQAIAREALTTLAPPAEAPR